MEKNGIMSSQSARLFIFFLLLKIVIIMALFLIMRRVKTMGLPLKGRALNPIMN
jgi:hypothetical protein